MMAWITRSKWGDWLYCRLHGLCPNCYCYLRREQHYASCTN